jgi:hypothetical protein
MPLNCGLNILLFLVILCFDFIVYKEFDLLSIDEWMIFAGRNTAFSSSGE